MVKSKNQASIGLLKHWKGPVQYMEEDEQEIRYKIQEALFNVGLHVNW